MKPEPIMDVLSLKKINNIDRQVELHKNDISEIVSAENGSKYLKFKLGPNSGRLRDFYEFYINDQPLINLISKKYRNGKAREDSGFFNTHIGCLGAFGKFWDGINISILSQKDFTEEQIQALFEMHKSNYSSTSDQISEQEIKKQIIDYVINEFLFYCCQDCRDSGCGGITFDIQKNENKIIWTDNEKIKVQFNVTDYNAVLENYMKMQYH